MSKDGYGDNHISRKAASLLSSLRREHGWSAQDLVNACLPIAAAHEPPLMPLTTDRVYRLEDERTAKIGADELWLVAQALGVSVLRFFPGEQEDPDTPSRLAALERDVAELKQALGIGSGLPPAEVMPENQV